MANYDINKIYEWPFGLRLLLLVFVSILVILLGYFIDIGPYQTQITNSIQQETDLKGQLQLMIEKQITMKNDIAQLPTLKALLLSWQQKILNKNEIPEMLDDILKSGHNNDLKITAFNPGAEIKDGIYYKTQVSIDMTGTYNQIATFISQLANKPKLINIDNFTISNNNERVASTTDTTQSLTSDITLTAQLDIEIYRK